MLSRISHSLRLWELCAASFLVLSLAPLPAAADSANSRPVPRLLREYFALSNPRQAALAAPIAPPQEGSSSAASPQAMRYVRIAPILFADRLWSAVIDVQDVVQVRIMNEGLYSFVPAKYLFHASGDFVFGKPVVLEPLASAPGASGKAPAPMDPAPTIQHLTLSPGPMHAMGWGAVTGQENISVKAYSDGAGVPSEAASVPLDPRRVSFAKLLTAFLVETDRTYFLQELRLAMLDARPRRRTRQDPMRDGRYTVFTENCISATMRAVLVALDPAARPDVRGDRMLRPHVGQLEDAPAPAALAADLALYAEASATLDRRLRDDQRSLDEGRAIAPLTIPEIDASLPEVKAAYDAAEAYRNASFGVRHTDIAIPWRARRLLQKVAQKP